MLAAVALWEVEQDLVASVNDIFYFLIDMVNEILTTNPKTWAENHGIWSVIENINNSLMTVAIQLAVIDFNNRNYDAFCKNSINRVFYNTYFRNYIKVIQCCNKYSWINNCDEQIHKSSRNGFRHNGYECYI